MKMTGEGGTESAVQSHMFDSLGKNCFGIFG